MTNSAMNLTLVLLASLFTSVAVASKSWAGSNLYFLQGLNDQQQNTYLDNLANAGAKVVRVWVNSQGQGCDKGINVQKNIPELESTPGNFNDATLDALDVVLTKLASRRMKAIISPHDANKLNGANGNDIYGQWYGSGDFYTNSQAATYYNNRLAHIMNYTGKTSGRQWKNWKEAIFAFDIQNEPMSPKISVCQNNDSADWMCNRARYMRSVLGGQNPIKIATGGIGGDISHNCNFMQKAMNCGQIDLVSVHAYKGPQSSNPNQWSGAVPSWLSQANGKLLMVEEFGTPQGSAQASEFNAQAGDLNKAGVPWTYWQITPPQECSSIGSDTYGVFQGQIDIKPALSGATSATAKQDWTGTIY